MDPTPELWVLSWSVLLVEIVDGPVIALLLDVVVPELVESIFVDVVILVPVRLLETGAEEPDAFVILFSVLYIFTNQNGINLV